MQPNSNPSDSTNSQKSAISSELTLKELISDWENRSQPINKFLWEELTYLRHRPQKKRKHEKQDNINSPVAIFSKPDRLKTGMGTEITLIMRSKACSWAHSNSGGCSMCGYWNDRANISIEGENYWNQYSSVLTRHKEILEDCSQQIVFKIFTSGSFCDPLEIPLEIQLRILESLCSYASIREIVIESRPEYLSPILLDRYQNIITTQYLEIAIGLETMNDYTRINLINKGFHTANFEGKVQLLHQYGFGVKAYFLFKPPFLTEYASIIDLRQSLTRCIDLQIDTISINPTNIQAHTICDELWRVGGFRSPWLYSLLHVIQTTFKAENLQKIRIICDPSAKGKERGVHNCQEKDPSNKNCLTILEKFIELQDLSIIPTNFSDSCYNHYIFNLFYNNQ